MANLKRKAFIRAYLGDAHGNATEAAKIAGYSEKTAGQIGFKLLKHPEVQRALSRVVQRVDSSTERCIANVSAIANRDAPKASALDILKANELLLKVNGALRDRQGDSRVIVNIGFLTSAAIDDRAVVVMPPSGHIGSHEDSENR
jgi:phage terminase small subunit